MKLPFLTYNYVLLAMCKCLKIYNFCHLKIMHKASKHSNAWRSRCWCQVAVAWCCRVASRARTAQPEEAVSTPLVFAPSWGANPAKRYMFLMSVLLRVPVYPCKVNLREIKHKMDGLCKRKMCGKEVSNNMTADRDKWKKKHTTGWR